MTAPAPTRTGSRLREAREARGLTQWEVARRTGVSASYLSMAERGLARLSPAIAAAAANAVGLEARDLAVAVPPVLVAARPLGVTAGSHRDVPASCPCDWEMTFSLGRLGRVTGWALARPATWCPHHGQRARRG